MSVEFGLDTSYGTPTWAVPAPPGGGQVSILVAGMLASSTYHMRARVQMPSGPPLFDEDQVFPTGPLPQGILPKLTVSSPGQPNPGVELINIIEPSFVSVESDLKGNIIWYYHNPTDDAWRGFAFPIKPLPNGNMLASVTNMYISNPTPAPARAPKRASCSPN